MAEINTTHGPMDDSQLIRREDSFDEEIGRITAVEYCLLDCPGEAHKTGQRDKPEHFCSLHVHRSIGIAVKQTPEIAGVLGKLGIGA